MSVLDCCFAQFSKSYWTIGTPINQASLAYTARPHDCNHTTHVNMFSVSLCTIGARTGYQFHCVSVNTKCCILGQFAYTPKNSKQPLSLLSLGPNPVVYIYMGSPQKSPGNHLGVIFDVPCSTWCCPYLFVSTAILGFPENRIGKCFISAPNPQAGCLQTASSETTACSTW